MNTIDGVKVWGEPLDNAVQQAVALLGDAEHVALMADHHLGYSQPIGGVVAYRDKVSPSGVGYDIGCGNKAVRLDMTGGELRANIGPIMDDVWNTISFGVGRKNAEDADHELFDDDPAWQIPVIGALKDKARAQLGTVGSGNHYVDLFTDEEDRVWIGVHFGSRGLGHCIATHFVKEGGGQDGVHSPAVLLDDQSTIGQDYIAAMMLAGRYAYAGRDWVCDRVAALLGATVVDSVHNHHNFAWSEWHDGEQFWVVRKGATPAFPGQRGFVGGSMGEASVILEGIGSEESVNALYSTVHGAGRAMSRSRAAGKRRKRWTCQARECNWFQAPGTHKPEACPDCGNPNLVKRWVQIQQGEVTREMMSEWVGRANVELRGAGLDESPHCYKRLPDVLDAHAGTIKILHTLTPVGVAMAGENEFDPFKD